MAQLVVHCTGNVEVVGLASTGSLASYPLKFHFAINLQMTSPRLLLVRLSVGFIQLSNKNYSLDQFLSRERQQCST